MRGGEKGLSNDWEALNFCLKPIGDIMDSAFERHQELVKLISDESTILEMSHDPVEGKRVTLILGFLVELQVIKARELVT